MEPDRADCLSKIIYTILIEQTFLLVSFIFLKIRVEPNHAGCLCKNRLHVYIVQKEQTAAPVLLIFLHIPVEPDCAPGGALSFTTTVRGVAGNEPVTTRYPDRSAG